MTNKIIDQLAKQHSVTMTALRKDVLAILLKAKKPMGAYDVLKKLKTVRPNAEPPTVYRVLDFFVENKIIHRIESNSTYVCCEIDHTQCKKSILFICKSCNSSNEYVADSLVNDLIKLGKKHSFYIQNLDSSPIEVPGLCESCNML